MIFPEGTRVAAGETRKYGVSGALLATRRRLIVPVAHDAGYYWPRRGLHENPARSASSSARRSTRGLDPRELNARAQQWIETTIAEMVARIW